MSAEIPQIGVLSSEFVRTLFEEPYQNSPRSREDFLQDLRWKKFPEEIIEAFRAVRREFFMPRGVPSEYNYSARPWPLAERVEGIYISDPNLVAEMTRFLKVERGQKVLEIGTGTGYQAGILKYLVGDEGEVVSCDIFDEISRLARNNLNNAGIPGVSLLTIDASGGYPDSAPYDRIIITCSLPPLLLKSHPLFEQLKNFGRLVAPLGGFGRENDSRLLTVEKDGEGLLHGELGTEDLIFTPMAGEFGWGRLKVSFRNFSLCSFLKMAGINFRHFL